MLEYLDEDIRDLKDIHGWTCVHWAIFRKQYTLVEDLILRGINLDQKSNSGVTARDLAFFTLDNNMIEMTESNINDVSVNFHKDLIVKLKLMNKIESNVFHSTYNNLLTKFIPCTFTMERLHIPQSHYCFLYQNKYEHGDWYTPIWAAIRDKNYFKIKLLIDNGWSDLIEEYINRHRYIKQNNKSE